ncbi:hypothetical protein FPV67DRAFT_1682566 [Lyophyllum atratum]|nr:hypothetical protein FPV67DRAFT_1682559 [Lyophyllum atratum]KAF8054484.1 hypothetical protein FPV67DRAFT_1682566 [Lyophyllum atratum]
MNKLSPEILEHIMQEIQADDGRSGTLAHTDGVLSLTEVCRFLRPIAQRVYYRAITYDPHHQRFNHTLALIHTPWLAGHVQEVTIVLRRPSHLSKPRNWQRALGDMPILTGLRRVRIEMTAPLFEWTSVPTLIQTALVGIISMLALGTLELYRMRLPSNFFFARLPIHTLHLDRVEVSGSTSGLAPPSRDNWVSTLRTLHLQDMKVGVELKTLFTHPSSSINACRILTLRTKARQIGPRTGDLQFLLMLTAGRLETWQHVDFPSPGETMTLAVDLGGHKALRHVDITCPHFQTSTAVLLSALGLEALNTIAVNLRPQDTVTLCLGSMDDILKQVDALARYSLRFTMLGLEFSDTDFSYIRGYFEEHMPTFIAGNRLKVFGCGDEFYNPSHPSFVRII